MWTLLGVFIFAGLAALWGDLFKSETSTWLKHLWPLPAFGALAMFACFLIVPVPTIDVRQAPVELVAMRSAGGATSTFVRRCGSVLDTVSYTFVEHPSHGSYVQSYAFEPEAVHIVEDPTLKKAGYVTITERKVDISSPLAWFLVKGPDKAEVRWDFRVPAGSVEQDTSDPNYQLIGK